MDNNLTESAAAIAEALASIDDELFLLRQTAYPERAPRETGGLPPGTVAQGFLNGRWNRRDGDVYASVGLQAVSGPNSPIRGGDDSQAQSYVPRGARRS